MGSQIWRASKYVSHGNARHLLVCIYDYLLTTLHRISFGAVQTRLSQGREIGAAITIADGSKVPLGIPGVTEKTKAGNRYAHVPLQKAATPTEAASAVLAAASPLFSYITGQTIEVDGGLFM